MLPKGVEVDLRVGNAMALGVEDDSFDVVLSVHGVMFAPDPDVATAELARRCVPEAWSLLPVMDARWLVVSLATMCRGGSAGVVGRSPTDEWGDAEIISPRLRACGLTAEVRDARFRGPFRSVDVAIDLLSFASPPHVTA